MHDLPGIIISVDPHVPVHFIARSPSEAGASALAQLLHHPAPCTLHPAPCVGCEVQGVGHRVQSAGCRVQGAGCRVQSAGCRVQGAECRVQVCKGCGVQGYMGVG